LLPVRSVKVVVEDSKCCALFLLFYLCSPFVCIFVALHPMLMQRAGKTKLSSVPSGGAAAAAAAPAAAAKGGAAAAPAKAAAKAPEPEPEEEEAGGFSLFD
jgi:ABC-type Na+ efflux pump permease subunit